MLARASSGIGETGRSLGRARGWERVNERTRVSRGWLVAGGSIVVASLGLDRMDDRSVLVSVLKATATGSLFVWLAVSTVPGQSEVRRACRSLTKSDRSIVMRLIRRGEAPVDDRLVPAVLTYGNYFGTEPGHQRVRDAVALMWVALGLGVFAVGVARGSWGAIGGLIFLLVPGILRSAERRRRALAASARAAVEATLTRFPSDAI